MTARVRDTSARGWKSQTWPTSLGTQVPPLVRSNLHSPANPQSRPEARSTSEQTQSPCQLPAPCSLSSHSVTAGPAPAGLWQSGKSVVRGGKTTCLAVNSAQCWNLPTPQHVQTCGFCGPVAAWDIVGNTVEVGPEATPEGRGPHCSQEHSLPG